MAVPGLSRIAGTGFDQLPRWQRSTLTATGLLAFGVPLFIGASHAFQAIDAASARDMARAAGHEAAAKAWFCDAAEHNRLPPVMLAPRGGVTSTIDCVAKDGTKFKLTVPGRLDQYEPGLVQKRAG